MKTPGYKMTCSNCGTSEFFEESEDYLDGDWYNGIPGTEYGGGHLCTDCWDEQENTRDEQAKLAQAEDNDQWGKLTDASESLIPYASAIRDSLNGEG